MYILIVHSIQFSSITAMWAQVIEQPLERRIIVLSNGTSNGLIGVIPTGGHMLPNSNVGCNEEWKKAQKKAKKKNTSDLMNKSIPMRIPFSTFMVCLPWKVASRVTSRHHWIIVSRMSVNPKYIKLLLYLCIHAASPVTMNKEPNAPVNGHGLKSTMWKGCFVIDPSTEDCLELNEIGNKTF